ncbi:hypothetical protein [Snodgrassella sp. CFCC 13594]|uniref:hypothetical protein n=1 Tax=Snodgrassella sp. CFCC 13594 TaxID=1775559 RepID=UPI0008327CD4|nr:hypothetical protein [Snodgrassella sp. CFCC 13594]
MKAFLKWLAGLFSNPETGAVSHSKVWANVACAVMTIKFILLPEPAIDVWWAFGSMVGGYALIRRGIAAAQQIGGSKNADQ